MDTIQLVLQTSTLMQTISFIAGVFAVIGVCVILDYSAKCDKSEEDFDPVFAWILLAVTFALLNLALIPLMMLGV